MADALSLRSLDHVSLRDACDALNMAYDGYIVPISFDTISLARRVHAEDIDLISSQLLLVDQKAAGIMLIARRGRTSRIAALGIATHLRGAGIGRQAVAVAVTDARSRGDERLILEVIKTNQKAISTYTKAGFKSRRSLIGYTHEPAPAENGVVSCQTEAVLPVLLSAYPTDPSWQTSPLCFAGATAPAEAFRTSDGAAAALVDATGPAVRLLAFAVQSSSQRQGIGRRFMEALLGRFPARSWIIPAILPESQATGFLVTTGWKQSALIQLEMEMALFNESGTPDVMI